MSLISILVYLAIIGVILYVVNKVIPMVEWMRIVINAVVAIAVLLWLLDAFGIASGVHFRLR